ncbi:MAG: hypothetical protein GY868_20060 [Deltaproteobacteria bacterium]|nr:hypothetical protein [Deltaproteobacteria bacterium]
MKLHTSRIRLMIKEYSGKTQASGGASRRNSLPISLDGKKKSVYKRTINQLFGKILQNSHQ